MSVVIGVDPELEPRTTPLSDVVRYVVGSTNYKLGGVAAAARAGPRAVQSCTAYVAAGA